MPNESLKNDAGGDLRAPGPGLPDEAIAVVFIIVIEIAEAEFRIDVPRDLAAEPSGSLARDIRSDPKTADVHLACQIKSLGQVVATTDPDIRIDPTFGQTKTAIKFLVQDIDDSLMHSHRVLPGLPYEEE